MIKELGFNVTVDTGLKTVGHLDVKWNLNDEIVEPYRKRNCELWYVNVKSNHPRHIIEKRLTGVGHRLSRNSSSGTIFEIITGLPVSIAESGVGHKMLNRSL